MSRLTAAVMLAVAASSAPRGLGFSMGEAHRRGFHFDPVNPPAPASPPVSPPPAPAPAPNLREEYNRLYTEAGQVVAACTSQNRQETAEETTAQTARYARMTAIKTTLDAQDRHVQFALQPGATANPPAGMQLPANAPGKVEFKAGEIIVGNTKVDLDKIDRVEFGAAMTRWAGTGVLDEKYATIITTTGSSILLPKQVTAPIATGAINSFREAFNAYALQPMQTPGNTATINMPIVDPTAGGLVAENASSETENAPDFAGSIVSTVKTYQSGSVYYSNLSLQANQFDLLAATVPHLEFNKELGLEAAIVAAMIADAGITQAKVLAATTAFTFTELAAWNNTLPKRYQYLKFNLLSATAYAAAEGMVDEESRPIMVMDAQNMNLKRMLGVPTIRCDYLEAITANKCIGLQISLSGFHLRDAGQGVQRYDQVPAKPSQTGINLFGFHAYGYSVAAVAKLKTAIS